MKTQTLQSLRILFLFVFGMVVLTQAQAQKVWTDTYTNGTANAAQWAVWNAFRATLVPLPYTKMKVTGVTGSVTNIDSCTDPVIVQDIANRLYTFTPTSPTYTWVDGSRTWRVGVCGTGAELCMNQNINTCNFSNGHTIRGGCTSCGSNYGAWGFPDCGAPTVTLTLEFFYGYPCTSIPTANISGPYQQCPNRPFTLIPDKFYADATYQWEYSDNNSSWQFWTGPVDPYSGGITDAIKAPRWYRLTITCNANPSLKYTTAVWKMDVADFMYCYCLNAAVNTTGLDIGNVTVKNKSNGATILNNGISTPALSNNTANKTYTNFQYAINPNIRMYRDSSYDILVSQINSAATFKAGNVAVFIDFDRNGVFDGVEKVMSKTITGATATPNTEGSTFTVPTAAKIGLTGMRVILSAGPTDSCGTFTEGEVEDYIVDLSYEPCKGPGNAGVVTSTYNKLCDGYDYVLSNNSYEKLKSELDRQWQISGDNIFWTQVNPGLNKDTLMRVFAGQPLYYRVRMVCPRTNDTTYTTSYLVDKKDGYKCYCYSQATGGIKDTSDIGGLKIKTFLQNSGGAHLQNPFAVNKRTDYTEDMPVELFVDSVYSFNVYHTMPTAEHGDAKVTIFMDFNADKEYDIPYERVYTGYTSIGNYTLVDNIYIPNMVITDVPTGMRVILNNNIAPNDPSDKGCGAYTSGETEDLMVVFRRVPPASVSSVTSVANFGIFPNPNNGKFRLQFDAPANDISVSITNVTGQQVQQFMFKHDGGQFVKEIDLGERPAGLYFVELKAGDQTAKKKLVIK